MSEAILNTIEGPKIENRENSRAVEVLENSLETVMSLRHHFIHLSEEFGLIDNARLK